MSGGRSPRAAGEPGNPALTTDTRRVLGLGNLRLTTQITRHATRRTLDIPI